MLQQNAFFAAMHVHSAMRQHRCHAAYKEGRSAAGLLATSIFHSVSCSLLAHG